MDYGREIAEAGPLSLAPRLGNRLVAPRQRRFLDAFAWLSARGKLDRLFARTARRLVGPFLYGLKLEVNTACSLSCRMCYVDRTGIELPRAALDRLFASVRGAGVRIEFLGGEPLLRANLVELVRAAKERARSPFVSLYTNALLADAAKSHALAGAGLDAVLVTLVSSRREVHDPFVGKAGAWERAIAGLENLRDAGLAVYTLTAVHRENVEELDELRRRVHELGVHATFYQYVPRGPDDPLALSAAAWDRAKKWVLSQSPGHMDFVRCFYLLTGSACSGGNFVLTVKADGRVQPCPFVSDVPLGSVLEEDIWTLYRRRYRGTRLGEFKRTPAECEPCAYRSVCAGGCRAAEGARAGRYDVKDHRCLGPFPGPLDPAAVLDRVPTFF